MRALGRDGLRQLLRDLGRRASPRTLPKLLAWAENAPPAHAGSPFHRQVLDALDDDRLENGRVRWT